METETLIDSALLRGDETAFGKIHERTYPFVQRVAYSFVRNETLAEDVAQATFLILLRKKPKIGSEPALLSWLWKTTRLTALRAIRDEKRRKKREVEAVLNSTTHEKQSGEDSYEVIKALSCLSERDRSLILMRYMNEQTIEQVATANGLSVSATQMRISRALEKVRRRTGILSVAIVIGALSTESAYAVAVPSLKTASALAMSLSKSSALSSLIFPISSLVLTRPLVTLGVCSTIAVGGGITYLVLKKPHFDVDRIAMEQFGRQFTGRYVGTLTQTNPNGNQTTSDTILIIRRTKDPDQFLIRSQYGDREVKTISFFFATEKGKLIVDNSVHDYEFGENRITFKMSVKDFVMEIPDTNPNLPNTTPQTKKSPTVVIAPATISLTMERNGNKLGVSWTVKSKLTIEEKSELEKK